MAAIKLAIFFFTLSPLLGAYHARHIHGSQLIHHFSFIIINLTTTKHVIGPDGCIYKSLDQRPPGKKMAEVIQMVTGEDTIYTLDIPNAPPFDGETIYSGDNPKTPMSYDQTIHGGDYLKAQPSPAEGGTGGTEAAYGRDNPKTPMPAKVAPPHGQTVYGGDYLNAEPSPTPGGTGGIQEVYSRYNPETPGPTKVAPSHGHTVDGGDYLNAQPSPTKGGTPDTEAAYGRDKPSTSPIFASEVQMEEDEDQTVLSIASHWLLSYTTRLFNNWK
ncbi:hypothetical protein LXL04_032008 [Taraxacum kok-saghyz]